MPMSFPKIGVSGVKERFSADDFGLVWTEDLESGNRTDSEVREGSPTVR
jgi:hypothetical protein